MKLVIVVLVELIISLVLIFKPTTVLAQPASDLQQSDAYTLLVTLYYPIIESFRWEPIKKLNTNFRAIYNEQYKGISLGVLNKTSNDKKIDNYFVALSKAVDKNLGPYFDKLKIPVSEKAKSEVQHLPEWLPEIFWFDPYLGSLHYKPSYILYD